jgi:uncharacterized protein (DUF486 family)
MWTILLLIVSNAFMTLAWYGHLKYKQAPLLTVIFASWGIALLEYVFQVPANRMGEVRYGFSLIQLKIMQECITLVVFSVIAYFMFQQVPKWNHVVSYLLVVGAVYFAFRK